MLSLDDARRSYRAARDLAARLSRAMAALHDNAQVVRTRHAALAARQADTLLRGLPLDALRTATAERLPLGPLEAAGHRRVGDLLGLDVDALDALTGLGPASARAIVAAVDALHAAAGEQARVRLDPDDRDPDAAALLRALDADRALRRAGGPHLADLQDLAERLPADLAAARAVSRLRWLFTSRAKRDAALRAADRLRQGLERAQRHDLAARADDLLALARRPVGDPWPEFERRAADYYARLSEFVPSATPVDAGRGYLTDEVVAQVEAQELDTALLRSTLRGYQRFGARFALVRRRVILGDEMGLGKTVQALAGLAHLRLSDRRPILVVAPASVMPNWEKEITVHTLLPALTLHGPDRQDEVTQWLNEGAIGVTTFDTLRLLALPADLQLAALVVDEAHYVKNPRTARSKAVAALSGLADHVWFLTGTPMENTVEEFRELIRYLQSDVAPRGVQPATLTSVAFRRSVAGVYLRRNAEDVLAELPPREEIAEWVRFTAADAARYRSAVAAGNLMAMRAAGLADPDPARCAKTERLVELVREASANGRKSVVYSYFRSSLETARTALIEAGVRLYGPITGDLAPARRQQLVDAYTAEPGPAVLLGQIQAGGVGLNIQAASVVLLCEPQLTPAAEEQAIARAHRMGQVRTVQVHRLLAVDSVDERILDLLSGKRDDFDAYARRSALAEATGAAVDLTVPEVTELLVGGEQRRLAG